MIEIDGSSGEGGGQVIRTALSLSAITGREIRITNIRAKRPNPGLAPQHLAAARAVRSISRGVLEGAEIGSASISFKPGPIVGGKYDFDIGTAGSSVLLAQTVIPVLLFASKPSAVSIKGGTHVMKSPSYDYFERVFVPALSLFGVQVKPELIHSGYYPAGGGEMRFQTRPCQLSGNSTWASEERVHALLRISSLPFHIALREKKVFVQAGIEPVPVVQEECGPGNALLLWSGFMGCYALGEKGRRAEDVASGCLEQIRQEKACGADVDCHLADQLLIYAALSSGPSSFKTSAITDHTKTNASVISAFCSRRISLESGSVSVE